jgi:hypothetical protein
MIAVLKLFNNDGMASRHISSKKPWKIALIFVRPPAFTLADERTITAVIGKPPSKPLTKLPAPWATKFAVCRRYSFNRVYFINRFKAQQGF